jgi:hypothetical protein
MKRTMKYLILIVLSCLLAASCIIRIGGGASIVGYCTEDGIDYTEVREVGRFNAISSSLPCTVYFSQSDKQEVRVESTKELAPNVLTVIEDGTLKLKLKEGRYPKLILRVVISVPDIQSISLRGSGDLIHEGSFRTGNSLSVKVSGSGDIRMGDIVCKAFEGHTSGSGNIGFDSIDCSDFSGSVSGSGNLRSGSVRCDGFGVSTSGSGDVDITTLVASGNGSARASGSGDISLRQVTVDGDLDLKTTGSADILVSGSCRDVTASTSGSGDISGDLSHAGMRVHSSGSGDINL